MSDTRQEACNRCKFGEPIEGQPQFLCRRFPPVARPLVEADVAGLPEGTTLVRAKQLCTAWPIVGPLDYCGEFKLRSKPRRTAEV